MRIVISGDATAVDADSGEEITSSAFLGKLAGLAVSGGVCSDSLDEPAFDEIDLTGGRIETAFHETQGLRVVTEYRSPRALSAEELAALAEYTRGQWSDGLGENGIEVIIDGRNILIDCSPFLGDDKPVVEQLGEDSPPAARFRKLFACVRRGDLSALRTAIAEGEELNCRKGGMSALQWAIAYGHSEATLLLIESGADVMAKDVLGETALECCAASRNLSDESAALIAVQLVARGSSSTDFVGHRERALEIARARSKVRLATFLANGRA